MAVFTLLKVVSSRDLILTSTRAVRVEPAVHAAPSPLIVMLSFTLVKLAKFHFAVSKLTVSPTLVPEHGYYVQKASNAQSAQIAAYDGSITITSEPNYGSSGATNDMCYWRSPTYIYSKFVVSALNALLIGLSVLNSDNSSRGLQNQMFGVFLFLTIFSQIINQIFNLFCEQRTQFEARERPSKMYAWQAFMFSNIIVELTWNSFMGVLSFILWYFPVGLYRNAEWTDQVHSRGMTAFLFVWAFFLLASTFGHAIIAALPTPDVAGGIFTLLFIMMFAFCGVLAGPHTLPRFWIFMYRVNPFTYIVEGFLGTTLANAPVTCASNELVEFQAPAGSTCSEYMETYPQMAGGYLANNSGDLSDCQFCAMKSTNDFLAGINVDFSNRWRDFGLIWVFIVFNVFTACFLYWLARVPKKTKVKSQ